MKVKPAPLLLDVSKALARPQVSWTTVTRAVAKGVTLDRLTEARHEALNHELWHVPLRRLRDPNVSACEVFEWLHAQGLPLSAGRATSLVVQALSASRVKDRFPAIQWLLDHGADLSLRTDYGPNLHKAGLAGAVTVDDLRQVMARGMDLDPSSADRPLIEQLMQDGHGQGLADGPCLARWTTTLLAAGIQARPNRHGATPLMRLAHRLRHTEPESSMTDQAEAWIELWEALVEAGNSPAQKARFDKGHLPDPADPGELMSARDALLTTPLAAPILARERQRALREQPATVSSRPRRRI